MITFDKDKLKQYIEAYKANFEQINREEIYKWCFVKIFQDNWDINALNFKGMFAKAVADKTITPFSGDKKEANNILETFRYYPRQFLLELIDVEPETVRSLFKNLFDESKSVTERNRDFQEKTQELYNKYKSNPNFSTFSYSYQRNLSVSYYLFLRYPDKYYISKYKVMKECAEKLNASWIPQKNDKDCENIEKCREFFDSICEVVKEDKDLLALSEKRLKNDMCYPDKNFKILTQDIVWFIVNKLEKLEKINEWWPALEEYNPDISTKKWLELLKDKEIFNDNSIKVLKALSTYPEGASCKELAEKFGKEPQFYNNVSWNLGLRVHNATNCPLFTGKNEEEKYWPVIYLCKKQDRDKNGSYVFKFRKELEIALKVFFEDKTKGYSKQNFLSEVFMVEEAYKKLVALLKRKKNIILQGAPGVGKTYAAKRLAYSLIGAKDDSKIEMVQFHQNYSYEDFVMGYRPSENGFNLQKGVFYEFCQKARNDLENDYYFIIDEINRGNLSSIFGELLMLIESDYRDEPVTLVYKKEEKFSVPHNVYIIGMMNTADRSIAMIDYALRRRFSFFTMQPGFETEGFKQMQKEAHSEIFNELIKRLIELNKDIAEDTSLGEGFCIGHSYFVYDKDKPQTGGVYAWLKNVIEYDICPMIDEYWFDDKDKANGWKKTLLGVFDK